MVSGKRKYNGDGKPQQSTTQIVSPGPERPCLWLAIIIALLVAMIYFSIVVGAFTQVWGYDHRPTLDHFKFVFGVGFKAVRDTLIIAGTATPFAGLLGMVIAYLVMRVKFPGRSFVESVTC